MSTQRSSSSSSPSEDIIRLRLEAWKREKERKDMMQDQSIKSSTQLSEMNQQKDFTRYTTSSISPPRSDTKIMKHGQMEYTDKDKKVLTTNSSNGIVERKNPSYTDVIRQRVSAYRFGYGLRTRPSAENSLENEEKKTLSTNSVVKRNEDGVNSTIKDNKPQNNSKNQQELKGNGEKLTQDSIKEGKSLTVVQKDSEGNKKQSVSDIESRNEESMKAKEKQLHSGSDSNSNEKLQSASINETSETKSAGQQQSKDAESDIAALSPEEYREFNRRAIINQLSQWKKDRIAKGYLKTTNKKKFSARQRNQRVIMRILWSLIAFQITVGLLCYAFESLFPTSVITLSVITPVARKWRYTLYMFTPITYIFNLLYVNIWLNLKAVAKSDMTWYEIRDEWVGKLNEAISSIKNCDERCVSTLISQSKSIVMARINNCRSFFARNAEQKKMEIEEKNMGASSLEKFYDNEAKIKQIKELVATQEAWAMQHLEKSKKERLAILQESNANLIETKSTVMETVKTLEQQTTNKIEDYNEQMAERFSQSLKEKINKIQSLEAEEVHLQAQGYPEPPEFKRNSLGYPEEDTLNTNFSGLPLPTMIFGFVLIFGYTLYALHVRNRRQHQRNQFGWDGQRQRGFRHTIRPVVSEDDEETPLLSVYDSDPESSSMNNFSNSSMMYSATSMSSAPSTRGDFSDFDDDEQSYSTSRSFSSQLIEGMSSFLSEELGSMYSSATEMFSSTSNATSMSKDYSQDMSTNENFDDSDVPDFSTSFFSTQLSADDQSELLDSTSNLQSQISQL